MAASGATRLGGGGDVRVMGKIRLECKYTEKNSYTLKYEDLRKVRKQAFKTLEEPVLQFAFRSIGKMKRYAVIPWGGDQSSEVIDHCISTWANSSIFTENQLDSCLQTGRLQLVFLKANDASPFGVFEIVHWSDFLERQNARDQHNSGIHGAPDPTKG